MKLEPMVVKNDLGEEECNPVRSVVPLHKNGKTCCSGSNRVIPETGLDLAPGLTDSQKALDTAPKGHRCICGKFFPT